MRFELTDPLHYPAIKDSRAADLAASKARADAAEQRIERAIQVLTHRDLGGDSQLLCGLADVLVHALRILRGEE